MRLPLYDMVDRLLTDEVALPGRPEYRWDRRKTFRSAFRFEESRTDRLCRAMRLWRLVRCVEAEASGLTFLANWVLRPRDEQSEIDTLCEIHRTWLSHRDKVHQQVGHLAWHKNVEFLKQSIMEYLVPSWPCLLEHAE